MRGAVLCAALACTCWPQAAMAQSLPLTEAEALDRLSRDSIRVRSIRAPLAVARADALSAGRWPNPRLSVERQAVAGVTEYYASLSQALPVTGRRRFEVLSAAALVSASSSRADDDVRRVRADLRLAFAELVSAQTREGHLTAARDRLHELTLVLTRREQAGDVAGFDRLRAEREALDLESDLVIAATDRAQAQARLSAYLEDGGDATRLVAIAPDSPSDDRTEVPELEALLRRAEAARGRLQAFAFDAEAAQFAVRAAERRTVPEPEVVVGTKSSTAGSGADGGVMVGSGAVGPLIGVQASIALFDRGRAERARGLARGSQAEAEAAAFRSHLRGEVAALREAVVQRRAAAARYRREALTRTSELERIARVSYDAGERGILELLDAHRLGATARLRQAQLDFAVRQAEIELEFTSGWEMP